MSLPDYFVVRLAHHTRVVDGGEALLGGSPTRYIRLAPSARAALNDREVRATTPVGARLADTLLELGMANPVVEQLPNNPAPYTVVIPVMDRAEELDRLLSSLRLPVGTVGAAGAADPIAADTGQLTPRVIVVDDGSRNPAPLRAVAERHGAEYVGLPVNVGPGAARNAGLARVTSEFVVFIDSDIVVEADTISLLLRHFADPKVALAAPRIVGLQDRTGGKAHDSAGRRAHDRTGGKAQDRTDRKDSARTGEKNQARRYVDPRPGRALRPPSNWIARYEDSRSSLDLGTRPAAVKPRSSVAWVPTACVVARVSAVASGFDESMRVGEDVDLAWRMAASGWRVRYEPAAHAEHEHRSEFTDWIRRKAIYGTSAAALAKRHPEDVAPAVLAPWSVGVILGLMAQRRWSVPVAVVITAWTSIRVGRRLNSAAHPYALGAWLTANGVVSQLAQASALLLRHWWPLAVLGCVVSPRMRRIVAVAAVTDIALEYRRDPAHLDPIRFGLAKRLDDVAYGAGVWWGALRARSWAALKPAWRTLR